MSFGYSVGDFLAILQLAKHIVEACIDGPPEFRELSREIQSFEIVIQRITADAKNPQSRLNRKGIPRKKDFDQIVENCKFTVEEVRKYVDEHSAIDTLGGGAPGTVKRVWRSYQVGSADLNNMRGKLIFWISCLTSFLNSLDPAAQTRIEHKLDLLMEKFGLASSDAGMSNVSVASVASVFSFRGGSPDLDSWKLIERGLLAEGVEQADIEDNREKIIQYVKDLVLSSLPTLDTENLIPAAASSTQVWTKNIARRQAFLAWLDQYSIYSQPAGKSSLDFKIQRVVHGSIYSEPASCITFDIWLRPGLSKYAEPSISLKVDSDRPDGASTSSDPPIIVKHSPSLMMRRAPKSKFPITAISGPGRIQKIYERESRLQADKIETKWTVKSTSSPTDRRTIEWQIRPLLRTDSELTIHIQMAIIVEHGKRAFSLEVKLSCKERGEPGIFRKRPSVNKIVISTETGPFLEDVDLDQRKYMVDPLMECQAIADDGEEVGLEYDGKEFTLAMVDEYPPSQIVIKGASG